MIVGCVLILLFSLTRVQSTVSPLYGVSPEKLSLYAESSTSWRCLTSGESIPYSQINDNFCDCPDGTDEPGTAACSFTEATFYCKNDGFLSKEIPTGFVNDGLCDCCDGSDEYSTTTNCHNTCENSRQDYYNKLRKKVDQLNVGNNMRQRYIENFHASAAMNPQRLELLQRQLVEVETNQTHYRKCLHDLKDESKNLYDCPPDVFSAEERPTEEFHEELHPSGHSLAEDDEWYSEDGQRHTVERKHGDLKSMLCREATRLLTEIEDSATHSAETFTELLTMSNHGEMNEMARIFVEFVFYSGDSQLSGLTLKENIENWKSTYCVEEKGDVSLMIYHVDDKLNSLDTQREEIVKEIENANFVSKFDIGDGAFYELLGRCYEFTKSFRYEFCPFRWVTHSDIDGSNVVNLGNFSGWNKGDDVVMFFSSGDLCQDGPFRRTNAQFVCGYTNEIKSVEEPEFCVYNIVMKTPAVCPAVLFEDEVRKVFGDGFISDEL